MRRALLSIGIGLSLIVAGALLIDEGEVIKLVTLDAAGADCETSLWIVEVPPTTYLRGSREAGWVRRIGSSAEVRIHRGEEEITYRATPTDQPSELEAVNRAMAEKYGTTDRMVNWFLDSSQTIAIRLSQIDPNS